MSISPGIKPGACFRFVHFETRRQKAKAAEFISADYYHHPSKAIVQRECRRIYFGGSLLTPYSTRCDRQVPGTQILFPKSFFLDFEPVAFD